ncbi:CvpA family protein [Novosphingobium sp. 9]|uniref:CvpA family protein n=1 Tax=Novosphingobium sp. 9 TaxID=2025349 RepID=UPI0021B690B9|nr:CvpA family protein [Novosphingobium sp. 9]
MTGFDIVVLLVVGIGAIIGFLRGFVQEILALAAWIFAILAIRGLHTPLTRMLESHVSSSSAAAVLAFAILLLVPYLIVRLVARWAGKRSRASVLGPIDRVLGFGFGALKGMIVVVLGFSVVVLGYDTIWGVKGRPDWMVDARTYPFIDASSRAVVKMISDRHHAMTSGEGSDTEAGTASAD